MLCWYYSVVESSDCEIKNRDGKRICMTLRKPDVPARGTVLIMHGMGGWKDQPALVAIAESSVRAGYITLSMDGADGAHGPDGDFFNSTLTDFIRDAEEVVSWMREQSWYTAPLIPMGHSMGALAALMLAYLHPKETGKLVLMSPAVSWKSGLWMYFPYALYWLVVGSRPTFTMSGFRRRPLGRAWLLDFSKYDGAALASSINVPVLVVSAGRDQTVAKPHINAAFAKKFPQGTHRIVEKVTHDYTGREVELADILQEWLSSS